MPPAQMAHLVEASARFTIPERLDQSDSATLFLTGSNEMQAHPAVGGGARAANAQRSGRGRNRYGPQLAPALSGSLLPDARRLALRYSRCLPR